MCRKLLSFFLLLSLSVSLSARTCAAMTMMTFPASGSQVANSELILIQFFGMYTYFHNSITNGKIFAISETGERDEMIIFDSRKGGHNSTQVLIKLDFKNIKANERFRLYVEGVPNVEYRDLTKRFTNYFEGQEWEIVEKQADKSPPIIPGGIKYDYVSSWLSGDGYSLAGRMVFIENGIRYSYDSIDKNIPRMLLRVTNSTGDFIYLPLVNGEFVWWQGYCSSLLPEVSMNKDHEFRVRLMDMSGNQLEEQNKLIVFRTN